MTESEAVEKLKNMRLFMQIEDENNDCKFTEDDYKANEMAIQALEKQIPKKPISITSVENSMYVKCPTCKLTTVLYDGCIMEYCKNCGQKLDWRDE